MVGTSASLVARSVVVVVVGGKGTLGHQVLQLSLQYLSSHSSSHYRSTLTSGSVLKSRKYLIVARIPRSRSGSTGGNWSLGFGKRRMVFR